MGPKKDVARRIAAEMELQILFGIYNPGDRLPSNVESKEFFGVSNCSVVAAKEKLKAWGYITASSKGTFVRPRECWRTNVGH